MTTEEVLPVTRTTGTRIDPRSRSGIRTRAAIVEAARVILERDGFRDSRISDITQEAGVANGSFYTYFASKIEVVNALLPGIEEDLLDPTAGPEVQNVPDIATRIETMIRAYLENYQRNVRLLKVLEEVTLAEETVAEWRLERSREFARRAAVDITNWQARGLVDPRLDPVVTARALSSMVVRMAYFVYAVGDTIPFEDLVANLGRLWVNALQLPVNAA
ncbi:MAG TPA: TetR/AcrR family transcriptional regulator [Trebonia sp.]